MSHCRCLSRAGFQGGSRSTGCWTLWSPPGCRETRSQAELHVLARLRGVGLGGSRSPPPRAAGVEQLDRAPSEQVKERGSTHLSTSFSTCSISHIGNSEHTMQLLNKIMLFLVLVCMWFFKALPRNQPLSQEQRDRRGKPGQPWTVVGHRDASAALPTVAAGR